MSELEITFLGTSASVPTISSNVAATLIQHEGRRFLVDCGEGTQRQMMRYGGLKAPVAIFLTHYHPDHWLGLPGLLATLKMAEHDAPVWIYGPSDGIDTIEMVCQRSGGSAKFAQFIGFDPGDKAVNVNAMITAFKTDHTSNSQGYVFQEHDRPGRFDVDRAIEINVKPGPAFAKLQRGEAVIAEDGHWVYPEAVIGAPRKGRKVVITGDTRPTERTIHAAEHADVLIHEATFSEVNYKRAKKVKHSTAAEAADVAGLAGVGRLYLTHVSPREDRAQLQIEARERFEASSVMRDGDVITIPFKDGS